MFLQNICVIFYPQYFDYQMELSINFMQTCLALNSTMIIIKSHGFFRFPGFSFLYYSTGFRIL